jgi:hypothetical protein
MLGHDKYTLGAKLDAESASLASFLDDMYDAVRHLDSVSI